MVASSILSSEGRGGFLLCFSTVVKQALKIRSWL